MRISLNWIARILGEDQLNITDDEILNKLIEHLAEIEGIESSLPDLEGVVTGKVLSCEQHPDADRLRVCTVDVAAGESLSIVCGAPNVAVGQTVAVATIGTVLSMPDEQGEMQSLKIKKGKLRGVASHGMICAEDELGLGNDHDGIMVLDKDTKIGIPLREALPNADKILDIDNHNINHRPDLWGHIGWAREISIIFDKSPAPEIITSFKPFGDNWSAVIDDPLCTTYCGAVIDLVDNRPSPQWMQDCLTSAGIRPIGLLIDVTNYVMLEQGEPMHAFDRRQISGTSIKVRAAEEDELFTTLDGQEHKLVAGDLLISDDEKSLALAGIMGGEGSMVKDDTTCIVLEAAIFDAGRIRRTRIRSGVSSESSNRFEKGLFPCMAPAAINRAIELITDELPNALVTNYFYDGKIESEPRLISYDFDLARRYIGVDISDEQQRGFLEKLGLKQQADQWLVPWWRHKDIDAAIDFVEEVGRLYGYAQLPAQVPRLPARVPQINQLRQNEHRCRSIMSSLSWDEIATYAFTSDAWAADLQWPEGTVINLDHPLSSEQTVMRLGMLPNLFDALMANSRHFDPIHVYEIGKIYGKNIFHEPCIDERMCLAGVVLEQDNDEPFYTARDTARSVLEGLGFQVSLQVPDKSEAGFDQQRMVQFIVNGELAGFAGEVAEDIRNKHKCKSNAAFFHIELEQLLDKTGAVKPVAMNKPSKFQQVEREFTWVCPEQLSWDELAKNVQSASGKLCRSIDLITVYRGDQIDDSHKAISMKVILQSDDHTLSEKEIQKASNKIIKTVEHQTSASLRA